MSQIKAPFTIDQIKTITLWQRDQTKHPLTCGKERSDKKHLDGEGVLIAIESGLICLYCDYKQDWSPIS